MVNRFLWSAAITLALTLTPGLAFSTPTQSVEKRSTKIARIAKKSESSKGSPGHSEDSGVAEPSMAPSYTRSGISETAPLMRVTPQRDGKFLLEPLTAPKKTITTPRSLPSNREGKNAGGSSNSRGFNTFEPWDFSQLVLSKAQAYRHTPYARGCSLETSSATDCSGFVQFIYQGFKINLPRSSAEQAYVGKFVTHQMDFSKLLPGDLLFFRRGDHSVGHAGIYLGEGMMIHASNHRNGVTVTDLRQPYYEGTFVVAKRVFEVNYPE